ncbi:MAG: carboxyl-terminal processing protease [Cellvibrionaceae bacterium]|jgi:carboxyl-terminal processing protease
MSLKSPRFLISLLSTVLLLIGVVTHALNDNLQGKIGQTDTGSINRATTLEIVKNLDKKHFVDLHIDDDLSALFLSNYLDKLDPNKAFFYQSDIDEFERYQSRLDDMLKAGDSSAGFIIHERFRQRLEQRLETIINQLRDLDLDFDFSLDEVIQQDNENSQWLAGETAANDYWRKRIKAYFLSQKLGGELLEKSHENLVKRYQNQLFRINKNSDEDIYEAFINAFTELYDPHTNYLAPRTAENFNISMSLSLEGIGAVLQSQDEYTKVVRLIAGGPAQKQGDLQTADLITGIAQGDGGDMIDVVGWRLDEVVSLIRGSKGSVVRLQVDPADPTKSDLKTIRITRDKVKLEDQAAQKAVFTVTVGSDKEPFKVGVINIPTFYIDFKAYRENDPNYRSTTRDVKRMLRELESEGVDGVIIDLRNNGGGSLQEATTLTDLFIDKGPVVQIGRGKMNSTTRSREKAFYRGPMVVMINRLSASASEIFAGAIQDYSRGLILGSQSFGKGTVQSLTPLKSKGDLKITESKFYRVSGDSTQHRGVIPDIQFPELLDTETIGESAYDTALAWSQTNPISHGDYLPIDKLLPLLTERHKQRVQWDPDFIFLNEQKKLLQQFGNRSSISLNERRRLEEKRQFELTTLNLENQLRKSKGQPAFTEYEALKKYNEEQGERRAASAGTTVIDTEDDALLREAGHILMDFNEILTNESDKQVAGSF